jgi:hypothetical protein
MFGHDLSGALAAPVERPVVIVLPGLAPSRFRMSQEENRLHRGGPKKSF